MTDKEKLQQMKGLADGMYYAAKKFFELGMSVNKQAIKHE